MDEQVLRGLGQTADRNAQVRASQYFEQLKSNPDAWKFCASALTSGTYHGNDQVKFFCLQVIEDFVKNRYLSCHEDDQVNMKSFLMACIQLQSNTATQDKSFMRNKISQIFSLSCVADYPRRWPGFFTDLLQTLPPDPQAADLYLRILLAVDMEVVDREIVHSQQETDRNTLVKDSMREQCVPQLVDSWYQIMNRYETSNADVVCMCMDVVGKYVSWIDINLIANDRFVAVLLKFMKMPLLRESACDCIHEIIGKGMDPIVKTKLIESFTSVLESAGITNPSVDEEGDYLAKLSKLINGIGTNLIFSWQKLSKSAGDGANADITLRAVENKIPLMFRFLGDDDDDVSEEMSGFAQEYINLLKQTLPMNAKHRENVESLLIVVIKKMKYDESYNFEQEGEEEAMFQEYRQQLKVIFNNLAHLDSELVLATVRGVIMRTLLHWETMEFRDVEMAISLLYMMGEALPASQGLQFSSDPNKNAPLQEMMRLLVTSRVSCQGHTVILLQLFETFVRYQKFFSCEPRHIADVLMTFLDERGFHHHSPKVRSRASYLFSRFVKGLGRNHLQGYLDDILEQMQDLFILNTPDNGCRHLMSDDDQLFLYETAGILIISSNFPPEKKQLLMKQLLSPIISKFESLLAKMYVETDSERQMAYARCINNAMSLASRASKGFSSQQTMKQSCCIETFTDILKVFLHALDSPVHRSAVQMGVRQFLHRMVVCLESEILPFIPEAMEKLLNKPDAKELHDFIPLMNQLIMKFKKTISPFLEQIFIPFVTTIYTVLSQPSDELDRVAADDKKMLRRSYFNFLTTIITNDILDVLKHQDMNNLHQVLVTVIQGAVDIPDPQSQKMCFNILKRLVEAWGGNDGLPGFVDFMYKSIVPACVMAPSKPSFDLNDAQTVLALRECALCLKSLHDKRGDEMINYLQSEYLPTLHLSAEIIQEFCQALNADSKQFTNYLKTFFIRAKS